MHVAVDVRDRVVYAIVGDGYMRADDVFHSYRLRDISEVEGLGIDKVVTVSEFKSILDNSTNRTAYCLRRPFKSRKNTSFPDETLTSMFNNLDDTILYTSLCQLRTIKSDAELDSMQLASDVGSRGMEIAMAAAMPGMTEHDIASIFELYCQFNKADFTLPYKPIVATGHNASILHYYPQAIDILDGSLVLFDMGCSVGYYASDISRTMPASGKFSSEQRVAIYKSGDI